MKEENSGCKENWIKIWVDEKKYDEGKRIRSKQKGR